MKKHSGRKRTTNPRKSSDPSGTPKKNRIRTIGIAVAGMAAAAIVCLAISFLFKKSDGSSTYVHRPQGTLTFSKDIAPILFHHCAPCHRPGQSAPFNLLSYADVKKRAELIAEVTEKRYMPPWLPEHGYGDFADERRLGEDEIGSIKQWVA